MTVDAGSGGHSRPVMRLGPGQLAAVERAVAEALRLDGPADAMLRAFFRGQPALGRRDRGTIADTVFDVLRHRRRYGHLAQPLRGPLPARLARLSIAARHGVAALPKPPVDEPEREALARVLTVDVDGLPQAVRLSLPDWLHAMLLADPGAADPGAADPGAADPGAADPAADTVERLGRALLEPAPLDLRVNVLKADRPGVLEALRQAGIEAIPLDAPDTAIRVPGRPALERLAAFEQGWFEVQDAGSQRLVEFAAPRRGQTVVDFCAGAGGKTLAIAAAMRSTGQVYACDVSGARLQRLKPRLARSGATSVQPFGIDSERDPKLGRLAGRADLVLVDAPCSGTGTLRRNPEIKWRLRPESIAKLSERQRAILAAAARLVKPGGSLVYATCSLLRQENEAVADAFGATHPGYRRTGVLALRPHLNGCDGFFAVRWVRDV